MEGTARARWEAERPARDLPLDTACIAPWVALELDPAGLVYACCANQSYPLGRIDEQRLPELWGGARAQVLREALSRWDLSVGCASCRWHFEHGRMDPDAAVYDRYPLATADPPGPVAMTFALSNRCNLGCVMCNPALSSTLRHQAGMAPLRVPYDDQFFDDLAAYLPGLRYAKFLGGEPFLIPEHHRVWDLMDRVGGPPAFQVTTNGTIWTDRVQQLLRDYRVDITISLDGVTTATYESIRRGSHHAEVLANVERFHAACRSSGAELRFCFCLMTVNWRELGPFLRWADELEVPVSVNVVSDEGLALHDLPAAGLEEVAGAWRDDDRQLGAALRTNAGVWATQLAQLEAVLGERRAGIAPAIRQPLAVPAGFFRGPVAPVDGGAEAVSAAATTAEAVAAVAAHVERLRRWSGGGAVAVIEVDPDGIVRGVPHEHDRLGLTSGALTGRHVDALAEVMSATDGRPLWVLDVERFADHTVRMVGLSTNPVRGNPASMVRTIEVPTADGSRLLVAEDLIFELRPHAGDVPVAAPTRRSVLDG